MKIDLKGSSFKDIGELLDAAGVDIDVVEQTLKRNKESTSFVAERERVTAAFNEIIAARKRISEAMNIADTVTEEFNEIFQKNKAIIETSVRGEAFDDFEDELSSLIAEGENSEAFYFEGRVSGGRREIELWEPSSFCR